MHTPPIAYYGLAFGFLAWALSLLWAVLEERAGQGSPWARAVLVGVVLFAAAALGCVASLL